MVVSHQVARIRLQTLQRSTYRCPARDRPDFELRWMSHKFDQFKKMGCLEVIWPYVVVHIISPTALSAHIEKLSGAVDAIQLEGELAGTAGHVFHLIGPPERRRQLVLNDIFKGLHRKKWQISGTVVSTQNSLGHGARTAILIHQFSEMSSCCQHNISTLLSLCTSELDPIQEHQTLVLFDTEIAQGTVLSVGAMRWSVVLGGTGWTSAIFRYWYWGNTHSNLDHCAKIINFYPENRQATHATHISRFSQWAASSGFPSSKAKITVKPYLDSRSRKNHI